VQTPYQNRTGIKLSLILALAALLRFWGLGVKQLWLDEILQVLHSSPNSLRGILDAVVLDRGGAPLDYAVQHIFMSGLGGSIEWSARFHAALFGVLSVLLVYLVCREIFSNERLSLLSALLFCIYPFHQRYSQEGRPYSLFVLLTLTMYFLLFRLVKKNRWPLWVCFGLSTVLAFYTHVYTAFVLCAQLVFLIVFQRSQKESWSMAWRRYAGFLVCATIAVAAYLPWLFFSYFNARGEIAPQINSRLFLEAIKRLSDGSYLLSTLLICSAVAGIFYLIRARRFLEMSSLLIWIIVPLPMVLVLLTWRSYDFVPRQLLFITPAFFILVASGIEYLKQKINRRYFYPEAIIILISIGIIALHYHDDRDDIRGAAQFLKVNVQSPDLVVAPQLANYMCLYFPEIYRYSANNRTAEDLMNAARNGSRIVYVSLLRLDTDSVRLNRLRSEMRKANEFRIRGVDIYYFLKP
jgi:mannosyltransferase